MKLFREFERKFYSFLCSCIAVCLCAAGLRRGRCGLLRTETRGGACHVLDLHDFHDFVGESGVCGVWDGVGAVAESDILTEGNL